MLCARSRRPAVIAFGASLIAALSRGGHPTEEEADPGRVREAVLERHASSLVLGIDDLLGERASLSGWTN